MNHEFVKKIISLAKKPLLQKVAGGFLLLFFVIFICRLLGTVSNEGKVIFLGDSQEEKIIKNYLRSDKILVKFINRKDYSVIKIKKYQKSYFLNNWKYFFYTPFFIYQEKELLKNSYQKKGTLIVKNVNLKELISEYKKITSRPFLSFLQSDTLTNDLLQEQEKKILVAIDGEIAMQINWDDNGNPVYWGKIELNNRQDREKARENFEDSVKFILGALSPKERKMVLPDKTYVTEIVSNKENFSFENKEIGKTKARYIKNNILGFEFVYNIKGNTMFFANSLEGISRAFTFFAQEKKFSGSLVAMPASFLRKSYLATGLIGEAIKKYDTVIFTENKKFNEMIIILK